MCVHLCVCAKYCENVATKIPMWPQWLFRIVFSM